MKKILFGFTGDSSRLRKFLGWRKFFYLCLPVAGALLIAFGGGFIGAYDLRNELSAAAGFKGYFIFVFHNPYIHMALGTALSLWGVVGGYYDLDNLRKENKSLTRKNASYKSLKKKYDDALEAHNALKSDIIKLYKDSVATWLKQIYKNISLGADCRVSIYYARQNVFSLLARHSRNPNFAEEHRAIFPLKSGIISKVWQNDEYSDFEVPLYEDSKEDYIKYMAEKYSCPKEIVAGLNMKSCSYYGLPIVDADEHIGVILFESVNKDGLTEHIGKIKKICENYQSYMAKFARDAVQLEQNLYAGKKRKFRIEDDIQLLKKNPNSGGRHGKT